MSYFWFTAMAVWLVYCVWYRLWLVLDFMRHYDFTAALILDASNSSLTVDNPQPELTQAPSPTIPLPNLYPLYPADGSKGDTNIDIIAVHGIETTSPKTWVAYEQDVEPRGRPCNWLKDADMLPSIIPRARIWAFDYNSNYSHNAQTVRIGGLATVLLNCIKDRHEDFQSRKLIFIGSCFGGIVVAEALLIASNAREDERKRAVFDQTGGVVFLGSPLRGTLAATFAGWKNFVFGVLNLTEESSCTLLNDLEMNSSRLETLVAEFARLTVQNRTQTRMEIRCFYETRPTQLLNSISRNSLIKPKEVILVDKLSACLDCHEHIPLDVRHAMMNKYRGPNDPSFQLVSGRLKEVVNKICADRSLTRAEKECIQALFFQYEDQKNVNPERVKGTCGWFLNHEKFLAWRQRTTANLLWVTAGPGCGKSVLSRALVDEGLLNLDIPQTITTSICYFFFKDDTERGSGVNALRSLLHQLFKQKVWLIKHALSDYETDGANLSLGTLWRILIKAVSDTNAGPVICILDALDECEALARTSLIEKLTSFHCDMKTKELKLKFIITSRPYHELHMDFPVDHLPSVHLQGDEMSGTIRKEIDLVISFEISRICKIRKLSDAIQIKIIEDLKSHENRTYLWVHLIFQEIKRSLESTKQKLSALLKTLPHSVDDAYEKILERAKDPNQAQKVLCLILAAERPLTLKELNTALEILVMHENGQMCTSEDEIELDDDEAFRKKITNLCGLFVTTVDEKVYLIHQTAKEFLINNKGITSIWSPSCWKYTFTAQTSHLQASRACLFYLELEFPDTARTQPEVHPFLQYASSNWVDHFRQAGEMADNELAEHALQICNTSTQWFLLWYQTLSAGIKYWDRPTEAKIDLTILCYFGLTSVINRFLSNNPNVNVESIEELGRTPFSYAASGGHEGVIKLLLDTNKVYIDSKDKYGQTPFSWAAREGHEGVIKLLLDTNKVDVDSKDKYGQTPFSWAAREGHESVIKLLLETNKVDIESKDNYSQTPFSFAAKEGHEDVIKLLLDTNKVDVDSKDDFGITPFSFAAGGGHEGVIKLLLETNKVDIESRDFVRQTPFAYAARRGREGVIKLLLDTNKVGVDSKDEDGCTPLSCSAKYGHMNVVKLLLDTNKVDVDSKDITGRTPLSYAAERGHMDVVKLLFETGKVNINSRDRFGHTPLWWAENQDPLWIDKEGQKAVVKFLLDLGQEEVDSDDWDTDTS